MIEAIAALVNVIGTQCIIVFGLAKGAQLLERVIENQRDRQHQWLEIQREVGMAQVARAGSLLGPIEFRATPPCD